ncbi:MAG TPA: HEAT repeat domain-containing protein [Calditrichia bacterium]|nr:HEAT repeat domain-containing protein [Calditrichota bacterium]HQU72564.1 HEAT repeat domain-containing protein [Calditrichia bacterium]HQV31730.1 HEAT repeat domain-containing protein [Calditrichia bacterium]
MFSFFNHLKSLPFSGLILLVLFLMPAGAFAREEPQDSSREVRQKLRERQGERDAELRRQQAELRREQARIQRKVRREMDFDREELQEEMERVADEMRNMHFDFDFHGLELPAAPMVDFDMPEIPYVIADIPEVVLPEFDFPDIPAAVAPVDPLVFPDFEMHFVPPMPEIGYFGQSPALTDEEQLRIEAIRSIRKFDAEKAVPALRKIIDEDSSPAVRMSALQTLHRYMDHPETLPILGKVAREDSDLKVRRMAVKMLGSSKDPRAAEFLEALLK